MFRKIYKFFTTDPAEGLPPHDPSKLTTSPTSKPWKVHEHWCTSCKTNRSHGEYMTDVCDNCGSYKKITPFGCSTRKIWNGNRWITQFNEQNKMWLEE